MPKFCQSYALNVLKIELWGLLLVLATFWPSHLYLHSYLLNYNYGLGWLVEQTRLQLAR